MTILESCEADLRDLLKQLNNLLTLEQAELGALTPDMAVIDLSELLEDISGEYKKKLQSKTQSLKISCSDDETFETRAELFLLRRALQALVENAFDAAPEGSTVNASLSRLAGKILLRISDSGKGIAPELQSKIFDRFRVVDGQAIAGMGLPLAYRLLTLQAAELKLESSNTEGTTFLCSFLESNGKHS